MPRTLDSTDALRLLMEGQQALAQVEANGMRIDEKYLDEAIARTGSLLKQKEEELKTDEIWRTWTKIYGDKSNLDSTEQLGKIIFDVMGVPCVDRTDTGRPKVDEEALERVKYPFVERYVDRKKLFTARNTFLLGVKKELVNGLLHPIYSLNTVISFRSSGSHPNPQNFPTRVERVAKLVKRMFIPRSDKHKIVEFDLKGAEVCNSACVVGSTLIETIDGPQSIKDIADRIKAGGKVYVYGYSHDKNRVCVAQATAGGLTKKKAEVWKVVLDNGEEVVGTPDHKFMLRNGEYRQLRDLTRGDSLMPLYMQNWRSSYGTVYKKVYLNNGRTEKAHNLISEDVFGIRIAGSKFIVHHADSNGCNNSIGNLDVMDRRTHMRIHGVQARKKHGSPRVDYLRSEEGRKFMSELATKINKERKDKWTEEDWKEFGRRVSDGLKRIGGVAGDRNGMYGKHHSDIARKRISAKKKGKKRTTKIWNKGLTAKSHPSLASASAKKRGRPSGRKGCKMPPVSEATRKALSVALKGRTFSTESRKKLSENKKAFWNRKSLENCPVCGKTVKALGSHMTRKHGMSAAKFREAGNHKVLAVFKVGYEDVYNLNVEGCHNYATHAGVIIKNCYHYDPTMIDYILTGYDYHKELAMQCFMLDKSEVTKAARHVAKGGFVFASFYGDYYINIAQNLWNGIETDRLTRVDGVGLKEHLASKGITELGKLERQPVPGTFEAHIKSIYDDFWNVRFPVYSQWKVDWFNAYLENGYCRSHTGFTYQGICKRNEIINYPIQGSSFHCLLWSLIRINQWLVKNKMRSMIIGQIHDSIIMDIHEDEYDDVMAYAYYTMTRAIREEWPWIIVNLDVEAAGSSENWYSKKDIDLKKLVA